MSPAIDMTCRVQKNLNRLKFFSVEFLNCCRKGLRKVKVDEYGVGKLPQIRTKEL